MLPNHEPNDRAGGEAPATDERARGATTASGDGEAESLGFGSGSTGAESGSAGLGSAESRSTDAESGSTGDEPRSLDAEPETWAAVDGPRVGEDLLPDHSFALCLTHDVDRPFKRVQALYYAARERDPRHLRALLPWCEPNWQFDAVRRIERDLGVRSAFYFLDEQRLLADRPPADWLDPDAWRLFADRYDVTDRRVAAEMRRLDREGWEVGLHGSYESYRDRERLRAEKRRIESALGGEIRGGRQHYLNRDLPATWRAQAAAGLRYDATLGSAETYGFQYGDTVLRPFGDEFVVFPLTMMELALPDPGEDVERAWDACKRVLDEAAERGAIATVLWHPRFFNERDWPGYATIYRRLVERALHLGAWVGPPGELYDLLDHDDVAAYGRWSREPAGGSSVGSAARPVGDSHAPDSEARLADDE